jgi:betaine lipid synthase
VCSLLNTDRILTIASAGDNVLDYVISGATVVAVDLNDCQLALSELKVAGAVALTYEEFWAVFGDCDGKKLAELYPRMRVHLSEAARTYWDRSHNKIANLM